MLLLWRLVSFIAVLVAVVWLVLPDGDYEFIFHLNRLVIFLGALAAFFAAEGADFSERKKSRTTAHPNDVRLLQRILGFLDPEGVIVVLRDHDFGGAFLRSDIDPLLRFAATQKGADKAFQNKTVEKKHVKLIASARKLSGLIAARTFPIGAGDGQSVRTPESANEPVPERVRQNAKDINDAADEFVNNFDEFIVVARREIPYAV